MLEKPDLPDATILTGLRDGWGLAVQSLDFLPIGNDARAWAYSVRCKPSVRWADSARYFLKLRRLPLDDVALDLPHALFSMGIRAVVAPLAALDGRLWRAAGDFGLILYPYIDGQNGMSAGLSPAQWVAFVGILRALHQARLPGALLERIPRETFHPAWLDMARRIDRLVFEQLFTCPYQADLAAFWRERSRQINELCARADEIGAMLRGRPQNFVLCHADIHTANLIVDPGGELHVVDWDQPVLAPPERDLTFVVSDGSPEHRGPEEAMFFEGYGETEIDLLALAYYRYEWCVQELGDYGQRVFFSPGLGEETLADSVNGIRALFAPGDVIEGAYRSEVGLPGDSRRRK